MQLQSGQAEVVVACGTENMTQLPYYLRKARDGYRMGHGELEDGLISILTWPEGPYHNGITAENVANASVLPAKRWTISPGRASRRR